MLTDKNSLKTIETSGLLGQ